MSLARPASMFRRRTPSKRGARIATATLATLAALAFAPSAKADEPLVGPLPVRHIVVSAQGATDAVLEERPAGSYEWVTVCTLPCEATVIANPEAEHRIADNDDGGQRMVRITGVEGERVVLRYERGAKGARIGFIVGGGVVGGIGVIVFGLGLLRALSNVNGLGEKCTSGCTHYDPGETAGIVAIGGVMALAGTLGVLHGVAIGKSSATTSNRPSGGDAPAPSEREPHWRAAVVAPSSPAMHLPLLDARF